MYAVTEAMVEAAQDAYDVACADEAVAWARCVETHGPSMSTSAETLAEAERAMAKWAIADAARGYAWAVLVSTRTDLRISA